MDHIPEHSRSRETQSTPHKEKQEKGKIMWKARAKTKDLENELKTIENRIKHMTLEQEKLKKITKQAEKKNNEINQIKEQEAKFKQEKIEWKLNQDQDVNFKRHLLNESRKLLRNSIREAKQQIITRNRVNSLCVKAQQKANEALLKKIKETSYNSIKTQADSVMREEINFKHRRCASTQLSREVKELEYSEKLKEEIDLQQSIKKKIEELAKIEENMTSSFIRLGNKFDNSRHLSCALFEKNPSPNKDFNRPFIV